MRLKHEASQPDIKDSSSGLSNTLLLQLILAFRLLVSQIVSLIISLVIYILRIFNRAAKLYSYSFPGHVIP